MHRKVSTLLNLFTAWCFNYTNHAGAIILEVQCQFATIEGLCDGTADDLDKCVAISTQFSIEDMIIPAHNPL